MDPETNKQIGRLEGGQRAIERSIAGLSEQIDRNNAELTRQVERVHSRLDTKADAARVDNHAARIRDLENRDAQDVGKAEGEAASDKRALQIIQGIVFVATIIMTALLASGRFP